MDGDGYILFKCRYKSSTNDALNAFIDKRCWDGGGAAQKYLVFLVNSLINTCS